MPKEKRYYLANPDNCEDDNLCLNSCSDEEFITEAENHGTVYTEQNFVVAFNEGYVSSETQFLRIIEVETPFEG